MPGFDINISAFLIAAMFGVAYFGLGYFTGFVDGLSQNLDTKEDLQLQVVPIGGPVVLPKGLADTQTTVGNVGNPVSGIIQAVAVQTQEPVPAVL